MSFSGQIYPENTVGYFRLASASGRAPIEPVCRGEFLIGSGPQCQLRLGGPGIPEVHTILTVEAQAITVKPLESQPPLIRNGSPCETGPLQDGDLLELLDHTLLFRRLVEEERITLDETEFSAADATPLELIDRMSSELETISGLEETQQKAVERLLSAVNASGAVDKPTSDNEDSQSELQEITRLLHQHHEASRIRLESLTEVLDNVVRQQKQIADALDVMSHRIADLSGGQGFGGHRASA